MSRIKLLFILLISSFSLAVSANEKSPFEIELVTGLAKPPFIMEDQKTGLQLDLIREIFNLQNMQVTYTAMPLGRNITGFQRGNVDAVITIPPEYKYPGMHISKPYITYQNVAVSLADSNIKIKSINDLHSYSIIAFQNAKKFLGNEFADVAAYSIDYRELANQKQQIEMLFARRVEVIILDINIFKYLMRESAYAETPFEVHYIFPKRPYGVGFKKLKHKKLFDEGLSTIKGNGTYQAVFDQYLF